MEQVVKVVKVTLGIVTNNWNVALEFPLQDLTQEQDQTQQHHHHMPSEGEPPKRQWLDVQNSTETSAPKLRLKNLDRGVRRTAELRIVPRESKVEIKALFKSPAYLDELFPIKIKVRNGEICPVVMEMDVDVQPIDPSIESQDSIILNAQAPIAAGTTETVQSLKGIRLLLSPTSRNTDRKEGEIPVGQWAEQIVYVRALEIPTPRAIVCRVRYQISLDKDQTKTWTEKQHSFRVLFIPPFDAEVDYILQPAGIHKDCGPGDVKKELPSILEPNRVDEKHGAVMIPALMQKEEYLLSTRVNNEGPWPVEVISSGAAAPREASSSGGLSRSHSIRRPGERKTLQEMGVHVELIESGVFAPSDLAEHNKGVCVQQWRPGNLQSFNHLVRVVAADLEIAPELIDIGFLRIQWRRYEEDDAQKVPYAITNVPLQPLTLPKAEVYMTVDLPKFAQINKPFTVRYQIHNPTGKLHELSMTIEPSEGMVYAGTMQTVIKLLPYASHPIQMNCYPLNAGLVRLPRVKLVEEVLVKVRGAMSLSGTRESTVSATTTTAGIEPVTIFVKPEAGIIE
ncbi:Trafficking protein particle complex subunit 11 [Modicella reniformis]|uniref:Trafficking protein particle complex subunit 11 n=1 Tax=Modicella reniformis TaxID=1440133 RepID=A0A9P6M1T9_9FUNG|nr:Trafficking protein particle complex subunit 11 [Modicella reniformis]